MVKQEDFLVLQNLQRRVQKILEKNKVASDGNWNDTCVIYENKLNNHLKIANSICTELENFKVKILKVVM